MLDFVKRLWWALALVSALASAGRAAEQAVVFDDPYTRSADGIVAYLGIIPAFVVRGHPTGHPESTMHGGAPRGVYDKHILVALFDAATSNRITGADVTATVEGLGHTGRTTKTLERMDVADAVSYGQYFAMPPSDIYTIRFEIVRSGRPKSVSITFKYKT